MGKLLQRNMSRKEGPRVVPKCMLCEPIFMQNPASKLWSARTIVGSIGSPELYIVCSQNDGQVYERNTKFLRPRDIDSKGPERTADLFPDPPAQPPSWS